MVDVLCVKLLNELMVECVVVEAVDIVDPGTMMEGDTVDAPGMMHDV